MRVRDPKTGRSRPARGEWIEIYALERYGKKWLGLAPRGASGLKYSIPSSISISVTSRPARGEWIEILKSSAVSLMVPSRPARGEWIEIGSPSSQYILSMVSPREGRVD